MKCPKCHAENKEGSRFCGRCAAPLSPSGPDGASLTKTLTTPVRILKPGTLIAGKYRILEEVGPEGMGVVYKAEDIKLKRCVALKFLPPDLTDSPELKERFFIEAQAAAALSHPKRGVVHEVGESEDLPYVVMEYLEGDVEAGAGGLEPIKARRRMRRKTLGLNVTYLLLGALAVILVLFALNVGGFRDRIFGGKGEAEPAIRLAVLPFVNLSGDSEQETLSDGVTQELITQLGRLHPASLSVIARTSVMRYKNAGTPIGQIGRELGVDYVLKGSARRGADRVRITAELVRVSDQAQIWADDFEREPSGILTLQGQVAQNVAKALAVKLLPAEEARLAIVRAINPEAYDAYLKGILLWRTLRPADLDAAQRCFEQALEKDPAYAPAFAGLSLVWLTRRFPTRSAPASEAGPKAKAAALQAIALDDDSAEAHEALAGFLSWYVWDWDGAEQEWKRALELNANSAFARAYYSHYLAVTGRADEALPHMERALKLDPFNSLYHMMHSVVLQYLRRYDEALDAARRASSLQPNAGNAQFQYIYLIKGMRDEQLADQRLRIARDPERIAAFERGLAEGGYEGAQRAIADVLAARYDKGEYADAIGIAMRYLDAGDRDRAVDWLDRAYETRDPGLAYIGRPHWDPLRSDPRFQALLRRIGLPLDKSN